MQKTVEVVAYRWSYLRVALVLATVTVLVPAMYGGVAGCGSALAATVPPEGRVYEMVSPPYKGGYGISGQRIAVAPNGEAVGFDSIGVFSDEASDLLLDNGYVARREPNGWVTTGTDPPATLSPGILAPVADYSQNFADSLTEPFGITVNYGSGRSPGGASFYLHNMSEPDVAASFVPASPVLTGATGGPVSVTYSGAAANLSHIVVASAEPLIPADIRSEEIEEERVEQLYELEGVDTPRLVGLTESGDISDPYCPVTLGSGFGSQYHAVSSTGTTIFFEANIEPEREFHCGKPYEEPENTKHNPAELFARLAGERTLEISKPLPAQCTQEPCLAASVEPAEERPTSVFQGASEDGSKVFFTTTQPLVNSAHDQTNNLYEAEIEGGTAKRLVLVSEGNVTDPNRGAGAEVQGVTRISDDGTHVYFVAYGVLTTTSNARDETAVAGSDNLYVYDTTTDEIQFVAGLCSGKERSGENGGVSHCPSEESDAGLWGIFDQREAQTTSDGRFLVFVTYSQLIRTGPEQDTGTSRDVYEYDAETGAIVRISVGEDGRDMNGSGTFNASIATPRYDDPSLEEQYEMNTRAVSEDGDTVIFISADSLSRNAINGVPDLYEWHDGQVSLISGGESREPISEAVVTPTGRDIFFVTDESLVPQDTNGQRDVYDARIGGGFGVSEAPLSGCYGGACQTSPSGAPTLAAASSSVPQTDGGNLPPSPGQPANPRSRTVTRAQQLKNALKACMEKSQKRRKSKKWLAACESRAKKRYGGARK